MKDVLRKIDLKKRLYLGPTTLDHHLTLILCNLARVQPGFLAYDPFVGTASILVALTHLG
jgi:tRNA (guanine10-N2)-methyltransferase